MRKRLLVWLAAVLCLAAMPAAASACTLFAANGADWVQGGGSLIVKNRDWTPEYQELRLVRNRTYAYYGIFGGEAEHLQLKGGVNAKGLAVFTASASAIPRAQRQLEHGPSQGTLSTLLGECASVGEALAHTEAEALDALAGGVGFALVALAGFAQAGAGNVQAMLVWLNRRRVSASISFFLASRVSLGTG